MEKKEYRSATMFLVFRFHKGPFYLLHIEFLGFHYYWGVPTNTWYTISFYYINHMPNAMKMQSRQYTLKHRACKDKKKI